MHVIGASGTGKSTLLLNLITQDIRNGDGVAVLDPHGDLIDAIIDRIPPECAGDVVVFDPADEEYPVGFNILSARSELEKNLLSSDLVAVFRRLSTSWGDQMNAVLGNGIIAFLESSRGGTLIGLRRFLVESAFRREFLTTVRDPEIVYFWTKEFPLLKGRPEGPVLTRLDTFLRPKLIRYMVGQKDSRLDFDEVMNRGRIFLGDFPMARSARKTPTCWGRCLSRNFTRSLLTGSEWRKQIADTSGFTWTNFRTSRLPQWPGFSPVWRNTGWDRPRPSGTSPACQCRSGRGDAISANAYTRVYFRVGNDDAKKLAEGLTSFEPMDLQNLAVGEAICRVEKPEFDFNLRTVPLENPNEQQAASNRETVIALSRQKFGARRQDIEAEFTRSRGETEEADKVVAPEVEQPKKPVVAKVQVNPAPAAIEPAPVRPPQMKSVVPGRACSDGPWRAGAYLPSAVHQTIC